MSEIRRRDFVKAAARALHIQAHLNPERMQGLGFGFAILPLLQRIYAEPAARAAALRRHLAYFATHPVLSGYVVGAAARLEERRAGGEPIADGTIDATKRALASPLAALGDPLLWVTLRPLAGLLGVIALLLLPPPVSGLPDVRVLLCPLITLLTYNAVALPYRIAGVPQGYLEGDRPAALLGSLHIFERHALLERAGAFAFGSFLVLAAWKWNLPAVLGGGSSVQRTLVVAPLLLGGVIGLFGSRVWPGRPVETALTALVAGAILAAWV
jgi:hypothetical protein